MYSVVFLIVIALVINQALAICDKKCAESIKKRPTMQPLICDAECTKAIQKGPTRQPLICDGDCIKGSRNEPTMQPYAYICGVHGPSDGTIQYEPYVTTESLSIKEDTAHNPQTPDEFESYSSKDGICVFGVEVENQDNQDGMCREGFKYISEENHKDFFEFRELLERINKHF